MNHGLRTTDYGLRTRGLGFFKVHGLFGLLLALSVSTAFGLETTPKELQDIGIENKLGAQIPLDLTFKDEAGKTVSLKQFFNKPKPVLLVLAYYECPNLCTLVLNGAAETLSQIPWKMGEQYEFVTVSINPKDTPQLAAEKKVNYLKAYGKPGGEEGWHFLVGDEANIQKLAEAVGFKYKYDEETKQYAHAAGLFILTPAGTLARVLKGVEFQPREVRMAMSEASEGKVGTVFDKLLLFCFRYDPKSSKYGLFATNLMKGGGVLTMAALGIYFMSSKKKG